MYPYITFQDSAFVSQISKKSPTQIFSQSQRDDLNWSMLGAEGSGAEGSDSKSFSDSRESNAHDNDDNEY